MALSIGQIDTWDTGAVEEFGRQVHQRSRALDALGASIADAATIPSWSGLGADAAHAAFTRLSGDVSDRAATVGAITELVASLVDQIKALQRALDQARTDADSAGMLITDAGTVVDGPLVDGPGARVRIGPVIGEEAAARQARQQARAEIELQVQALLRVAADVENDTTRVLTRAAEGGFTGDSMVAEDARERGRYAADGMFQAPPPPDDVDAQQHYLDALSPDQAGEILREHPDWLAGAYGINPRVREQAAEAYLPVLRGELLNERAQLMRDIQEISDSAGVGPGARVTADGLARPLEDRLGAVAMMLADLDEVEKMTGSNADVHLLGLRAYDDGVGAVVARGDIATADNVAVHVPGMGTQTRDNPDAGNDLLGEMDKLAALETEMDLSLIDAGRGHETVATVTYLNMEFPGQNRAVPFNFVEAGDGLYADTAAPDLAGVLSGIKATSENGNTLTALGHSYGSLTTSEALQAGGTVDNVVFYGSPGLETSGEAFDADTLGVGPGNRYVMLADNEEIRAAHLLDPFGGIPHEDPELIRLETDARSDRGGDRDLLESTGHSQYEKPDSTSLHNLAAIATGVPENAILHE